MQIFKKDEFCRFCQNADATPHIVIHNRAAVGGDYRRMELPRCAAVKCGKGKR